LAKRQKFVFNSLTSNKYVVVSMWSKQKALICI